MIRLKNKIELHKCIRRLMDTGDWNPLTIKHGQHSSILKLQVSKKKKVIHTTSLPPIKEYFVKGSF